MAVPEEGERGTAGAGKKGKKDGKSGEKASAKKSPGNTGRSGADVSDEQLEEWARNDAAALSQLIALIPQVHLKPQDQGRQIAKKYMKKVNDTVSEKVSRAAKKRAKFDGSEPATDSRDSDKDEDEDEDEDSENDEEMSDDDGEEEKEGPDAKRGRATQGAPADIKALKPTQRATSREELQLLLAKKMQQFASNRPKTDGESGEKASEARKRKREDRQEKKKKLKAKEKKKQTSVPIPNPMPKESSRASKHNDASSEGNDEAFSFGRIKMAGEDVVGGGRDKGKKYREQPEKLLEKIQEKKKKLEELGGEESEQGKAFIERQKWGASIDRAQGVKVKDDEGLLKKTIAKKTKVKAKRTEKWTKRAQDIEETKSKRMQVRNENIKKRAQDRRDKKLGVKKKSSSKSDKPSKPKSRKS